MFMVTVNGVNVYQGKNEETAFKVLSKHVQKATVIIYKYDTKRKEPVEIVKVS